MPQTPRSNPDRRGLRVILHDSRGAEDGYIDHRDAVDEEDAAQEAANLLEETDELYAGWGVSVVEIDAHGKVLR